MGEVVLTIKQTGWILAGLLILLLAYLRRLSLSEKKQYKNFNIIELITNKDGHIDQSKFHSEGAFWVSSYGFLYLLWDEKLTEWYFSAYMAAWVLYRAYSLKKTTEGEKNADH
jgi:hypothetical protein